jgi:hypothetical protein
LSLDSIELGRSNSFLKATLKQSLNSKAQVWTNCLTRLWDNSHIKHAHTCRPVPFARAQTGELSVCQCVDTIYRATQMRDGSRSSSHPYRRGRPVVVHVSLKTVNIVYSHIVDDLERGFQATDPRRLSGNMFQIQLILGSSTCKFRLTRISPNKWWLPLAIGFNLADVIL